MDYKLKDKVAIVGGGSKGLGKACAMSLAKEGVNIVLCARNEETLEETRKKINTFISVWRFFLKGNFKCPF